MEQLKATLVGEAPLIMHNVQTADPMNKYAIEIKRLSTVRKKSEEQHLELRKVEWFAGLYLEDGRIVIPADVIFAVLIQGARRSKLGKKCEAGIVVAKDAFPLTYEGTTNLEKLYTGGTCTDCRPVRVGQSKVMRTRPRFDVWSVEVELLIDTDLIDVDQVKEAIEVAGLQMGVGDFRPRYGRFKVQW